MTYTAFEMRQRSEWLAGYAKLREQEIGSFAASQIKESAQMLRQAADAMENPKPVPLPGCDCDECCELRAAMQDKGEG